MLSDTFQEMNVQIKYAVKIALLFIILNVVYGIFEVFLTEVFNIEEKIIDLFLYSLELLLLIYFYDIFNIKISSSLNPKIIKVNVVYQLIAAIVILVITYHGTNKLILLLNMNDILSPIIDFKYPSVLSEYMIVILSFAVLTPIIEEMLFRGLLYNILRKENPVIKSIIITTLIFTVFHINIFLLFYYAAINTVICLIYEINRNILYPIILHSFTNLYAITLAFGWHSL